MRHPVTNFHIYPRTSWAPLAAQYTRQDGKGWVWLQRLAFWVLDKIGAHTLEEKLSIRRVQINHDDVLKQIRSVMDAGWRLDYQPEVILMGHEDFDNLVSEGRKSGADRTSILTFAFDGSGDQEVYGMRIVIVPWMKGILPLPNLAKL